MRTIRNEDIVITDVQDERIWIQSDSLGYGRWIPNSELRNLIENKEKK